MKGLKIGLAAGALILASAFAAKADGIDPVLKMGGPGGSPNCFNGGIGFQATTGPGGAFIVECVNNGTTDVTSFSFEILAVDAPGGITVILDNLLAPFTGALSFLNWQSEGCTLSNGIDTCTVEKSPFVSSFESSLCTLANFGSSCSQLSTLSASQMETDFPNFFTKYSNNPCQDPFVYVIFGVIPGCDLSASGTAGDEEGLFRPNSPVGLTPEGATPPSLAPEPGSLAMLLVGLGGLPLLPRRFARC